MKNLLYLVPILGIIAFTITTILNWQNYEKYIASGGSAPFSAFVIANAILYLIPAVVITFTIFFLKRIFRS